MISLQTNISKILTFRSKKKFLFLIQSSRNQRAKLLAAPTALRVPSVPFRASSASIQILDNRNLTHRHVIDGRFAISFDLRPALDRVMQSTLSPVPTVRQEQALKARESEAQLGIRVF